MTLTKGMSEGTLILITLMRCIDLDAPHAYLLRKAQIIFVKEVNKKKESFSVQAESQGLNELKNISNFEEYNSRSDLEIIDTIQVRV
jgi:hypothetical protein